jgi:hypothetical protein
LSTISIRASATVRLNDSECSNRDVGFRALVGFRDVDGTSLTRSRSNVHQLRGRGGRLYAR